MVNEPNPASLTVARLQAALQDARPDQVVLFVLGRNQIKTVSASDGLGSIAFNVELPAYPGAEHGTFMLRPMDDSADLRDG